MTAYASPRRRRAFDPRIAVGVVLVVASVAGMVAIVTATDRSVTVYAATQQLVAGARVTDQDVVATRVRLGSAQALYLAGRLPAAGYVVTRQIAAGEIVPLSALGTASSIDLATVVVDLSTRPAASIAGGSTVDLWSAPKSTTSQGTFGAPVMLVGGATVVRLVATGGIVAAGTQNSIEVQVPRDDVAQVLQAVADGDALSAVAVTDPVAR